MVQRGILSKSLTEAFFVDRAVTAASYSNLIQQSTLARTRENFGEGGKFHFHQNKTPVHYYRTLRAYPVRAPCDRLDEKLS